MKQLVSYNEELNSDGACLKLLQKKLGTVIRIGDKVGFKLSDYYLSMSEGFGEYIGWSIRDFSSEHTILKYEENNTHEYFIYSSFIEAILDDHIGYLYLIECQGFYKIGISNDFGERFKRYITENPFEMEVIFAIQCYGYSLLETIIKQHFKEKLHRGERFKFDEGDVVTIMKMVYIADYDYIDKGVFKVTPFLAETDLHTSIEMEKERLESSNNFIPSN